MSAPQYDTPTTTVLYTDDNAGLMGALAEVGSHAVMYASTSIDNAVVTVLDARGVSLVSYLVPDGVTEAHVTDLLTTHTVSLVGPARILSFPLVAALMPPAPRSQLATVLRGPLPSLILDDPSVLLDRATHFIADAYSLGVCDAAGTPLSGLYLKGSPYWSQILANGFLLLVTPTRRVLLRSIT